MHTPTTLRAALLLLWLGLLCVGCGPSIPDARPLPDGPGFAGRWNSNWGRMKLSMSKGRVFGRYEGFRSGYLSGEHEGDLWHFMWSQDEPKMWGRGYMQLAPDGQTMRGRWGYEKDATGGGVWRANRLPD